MILTTNTYEVEKSDDLIETTRFFSIKSPAIIFDILCTKLYENPLKSLVQEYASNARDAHRECNKDDVPITIVLPTIISPTLRICDEGIGISPDRMSNVFLYLGESTKTSDNTQTGGYGIGAKISWAYTESFTIYTINNGIEYSYLAYLGDHGKPQLSLLSIEHAVDKKSGTTIEVVIKRDDIAKVSDYVLLTTHFWDVRPIVKNISDHCNCSYNDELTTTRIEDIICIENPTSKYSYLEIGNSIHAIIDGIVYRNIDKNIEDLSKKFSMGNYKSFFIVLNTGDVDIAINRENLQYTLKTKEVIEKKVSTCLNSIKDSIESNFSNYPTIPKLLENADGLINVVNFVKYPLLTYQNIQLQIFYLPNAYRGGNKNIQFFYNFNSSQFASDVKISFFRLTSDHRLVRDKTQADVNRFKISQDFFDNCIYIFNDKKNTTINRVKIKKYMIENDKKGLCYISSYIDLEKFMTDHKTFFKVFEDVIIKTSSLAAFKTKKRNVVKRKYNNIRFEDTDRIKYDDFEKFINEYTPLCVDKKGATNINFHLKNKLLFQYNKLNGTNYKIIIVTAIDKSAIKHTGHYIDFNNWFEEVGIDIYKNLPRKILRKIIFNEAQYLIRPKITKNYHSEVFNNKINNCLNDDNILDQNIKQYFILFNKLKAGMYSSDEYSYEFGFLRDIFNNNLCTIPEFDNIVNHIIKITNKVKKLHDYIYKNYSLICARHFGNFTDSTIFQDEIIAYANYKYALIQNNNSSKKE